MGGRGGSGGRAAARGAAAGSARVRAASGGFVADVLEAMKSAPDEGNDRRLISEAYDAYMATPQGKALGLTLEEFKTRLVAANRARQLDLTRLDLIEAYRGKRRDEVDRSTIRLPEYGEFQFVRPKR